jgi:hypothetical protein
MVSGSGAAAGAVEACELGADTWTLATLVEASTAGSDVDGWPTVGCARASEG